MKTIIINIVMILAITLLTLQIIQAQGTTYLSNLGQASDGNLAVGSDSWIAGGISTGNNADGYSLDSVQLTMTDASGNPSGFTAMIYGAADIHGGIFPASSLRTLGGSLNPATGGIFTYTPVSSLTLAPNTDYFIVLTAGTAGAYEWSFTHSSVFNPGDAWVLSISLGSSDGSNWNFMSGDFAQFALNATAVPEPSSSWLLLLCSGIFIYARRASHR
jgi:hypothetical protein